MIHNVLCLTRGKCFVLILIICLRNPSVLIHGVPLPDSGVPPHGDLYDKVEGVSGDFEQNLPDHTGPKTSANQKDRLIIQGFLKIDQPQPNELNEDPRKAVDVITGGNYDYVFKTNDEADEEAPHVAGTSYEDKYESSIENKMGQPGKEGLKEIPGESVVAQTNDALPNVVGQIGIKNGGPFENQEIQSVNRGLQEIPGGIDGIGNDEAILRAVEPIASKDEGLSEYQKVQSVNKADDEINSEETNNIATTVDVISDAIGANNIHPEGTIAKREVQTTDGDFQKHLKDNFLKMSNKKNDYTPEQNEPISKPLETKGVRLDFQQVGNQPVNEGLKEIPSRVDEISNEQTHLLPLPIDKTNVKVPLLEGTHLEQDLPLVESKEIADQTISRIEQLADDNSEKKESPKQPEDILLQEKMYLQKIISEFNDLKNGNFPELNVIVKMRDSSKGKDSGSPSTGKSEKADSKKDTNKQLIPEKNNDVGEHLENLSEEERRLKLKEKLETLKRDQKALKNQAKNDIYNPPGLSIDQARRKVVLKNLRLLKTDKGAFELSVNSHFAVDSREKSPNSTTRFLQVEHARLMEVAAEAAKTKVSKPKFRTDHELRRQVAEIRIEPFTEIGSSENSNFFGPAPAYVWTPVPSHYSYLGLLNTPDKFKVTELDKKILSHFNAQVMDRLRVELGDEWGEVKKTEVVEENEENGYEANGEDMKRISHRHGHQMRRSHSI